MIIVQLCGGIGNQMFQYAAARSLALANNTELKLDVTTFSESHGRGTQRGYALGVFALAGEFASAEEILQLKRPKAKKVVRALRRIASAAVPSLGSTHIRERHFHFDPGFFDIRDNVYLEGYWQSEKYFAKIEDVIRADFAFKYPPEGANSSLSEEIQGPETFGPETFGPETVSVHVRRGDYVTNLKYSRDIGTCPPEYYAEAARVIAEHTKSPSYYVFSDDPAWARENLSFEGPVSFVDHNGPESAHEDMRLMSLCKHHIIANSSFSWWGAWLSRHIGKVIVAPACWFKREDWDTADLVPKGWIKVGG